MHAYASFPQHLFPDVPVVCKPLSLRRKVVETRSHRDHQHQRNDLRSPSATTVRGQVLQQTDTRSPHRGWFTCFQFTGTDPLACDPSEALPMLSSRRPRLSRSGVAPDSPPELPMSSRWRLTANDADGSTSGEPAAGESRGSAHGGGSPRSASLRTGGAASLVLERGSNHAATLQQRTRSTISKQSS